MENVNTPTESNPYKISIDEAKNIALDFIQTFQRTPAARSAGIEVDNMDILKIRVQFKDPIPSIIDAFYDNQKAQYIGLDVICFEIKNV